MAAVAYIVFPGERQWHVGVASQEISVLAAPSDPAGVASLLTEKGWKGEPVLLALPSAWCLAAGISTEGAGRKNRRQALGFRLEEKLPLAAEEFVADFVEENGQALGVCAPLATLRPLIDALSAAGITVAAICPAVLLAMQEQLAAGADGDVMIWEEGDRVNLLIRAGAAPAWHLVPNANRDVLLQLRVAAMAAGRKLRAGGGELTNPALSAAIQASPDVESLSCQGRSLLDSAAAGAAAILSGRRQALVNLRRDALAMDDPFEQIARPLNFLAGTAIIGLLCICAAMLWRAHRYDLAGEGKEREAAALFHQTLPDQPAPPAANVLGRLQSEQQKLLAVSGQSTEAMARVSALALLRDALAALPGDVYFRLTDIDVGAGTLYLQGQTRTHSDAEVIAERLRSGARFTLPEPRSEQQPDQTVKFVISGTSKAASPAPGATP
jgi:hypothetical protein